MLNSSWDLNLGLVRWGLLRTARTRQGFLGGFPGDPLQMRPRLDFPAPLCREAPRRSCHFLGGHTAWDGNPQGTFGGPTWAPDILIECCEVKFLHLLLSDL